MSAIRMDVLDQQERITFIFYKEKQKQLNHFVIPLSSEFN